jgi:hypothetical protein
MSMRPSTTVTTVKSIGELVGFIAKRLTVIESKMIPEYFGFVAIVRVS